MSSAVVYILTLLPSNRFYIGSAEDVDKRFKRHLLELENGTHHNALLQASWYGTMHINVAVVEEYPTRQAAYEAEDVWIKKFKSSALSHLCCNIGRDSVGGDNLSDHPNKTVIVEKMTASLHVRYNALGPEERTRIYGRPGKLNGMFGKHQPQHVREAVSKAQKGNTWRLGSKLTEKQKENLSDRARLRIGEKNPFYGKIHSPATKLLLAQARRGKTPTNIRAVKVGQEVFPSVAAAAKHHDISPALVVHRVKRDSYPEWGYLNQTDGK